MMRNNEPAALLDAIQRIMSISLLFGFSTAILAALCAASGGHSLQVCLRSALLSLGIGTVSFSGLSVGLGYVLFSKLQPRILTNLRE